MEIFKEGNRETELLKQYRIGESDFLNYVFKDGRFEMFLSAYIADSLGAMDKEKNSMRIEL